MAVNPRPTTSFHKPVFMEESHLLIWQSPTLSLYSIKHLSCCFRTANQPPVGFNGALVVCTRKDCFITAVKLGAAKFEERADAAIIINAITA